MHSLSKHFKCCSAHQIHGAKFKLAYYKIYSLRDKENFYFSSMIIQKNKLTSIKMAIMVATAYNVAASNNSVSVSSCLNL